MRYLVLATDYDGTLAQDGAVDAAACDALARLAATGRKLILVTGRELGELESVFPHLELFDRVVAENGALLLAPSTREVRARPAAAGYIHRRAQAPRRHAAVGRPRDRGHPPAARNRRPASDRRIATRLAGRSQ